MPLSINECSGTHVCKLIQTEHLQSICFTGIPCYCIQMHRRETRWQFLPDNRELLTMLIQQQQQVTLRRAIMRKKILTSN